MIQFHDTMTRTKREFKPITPGKVRMYVCGSTVYDYCHIGHGRVFVAFDIIARYLRWRGFEVTYVRNITDIDDKIINRANEAGEDWQALTARFTQTLHEDDQALGNLPPDQEPRATAHMPQIIEMIACLIENGKAYVAENGDVYYDISQYPEYGKLANQNLDDLRAGARVDILDVKHAPLDFVLWKLAKPDEPFWDSPWGAGRPGWHIECSAMSTHCLGDTFDIHGGGIDLKFPHHQNEVAQSEGATGKRFVNCWMHSGHVNVDNEKMSKSLGNFFTIREVLKYYRAEVIRYFLLASHYRSPVNYSEDNLKSAEQALTRLYGGLRGLDIGDITIDKDVGKDFREQFYAAMDDDFNTPIAFSVMFDVVREIHLLKDVDRDQACKFAVLLKQFGGVLGFLDQDPDVFFQQGTIDDDIDVEEIETMIEARNAARATKDWVAADNIRDTLLEKGIELEDGAGGTTWRNAGARRVD